MTFYPVVKDMEILTDEDRKELGQIGHRIRYPAGSILVGEGEETDFTLLILGGYVKVTSGSPDRVVAVTGPGETVGEMAALDGEPRSASAFALSDVEALYLPASAWLEFLYGHPRVMHAMLRAQNSKLRAETRKRIETSDLEVVQRLARSLVELEAMIGEHTSEGIAIVMSQRDLAGYVNASRESVAKVFHFLREEGMVSTRRQKVIVTDLDALRQVASGERIASH
jgi:CRP/FNR family cyclic AMP-dependent transcriptional regulator